MNAIKLTDRRPDTDKVLTERIANAVIDKHCMYKIQCLISSFFLFM